MNADKQIDGKERSVSRKKSRERFDYENYMDVCIVDSDDYNDNNADNDHDDNIGSDVKVKNREMFVHTDAKRLRRLWENGNIDLFHSASQISDASDLLEMKEVVRGKRDRGCFTNHGAGNADEGIVDEVDNTDHDRIRHAGSEDDGMDDCMNKALKKLRMSEEQEPSSSVSMTRRLPAFESPAEERGNDVDFKSVNKVLNELYRERCFRKNVSAYASLAESLSQEVSPNCNLTEVITPTSNSQESRETFTYTKSNDSNYKSSTNSSGDSGSSSYPP